VRRTACRARDTHRRFFHCSRQGQKFIAGLTGNSSACTIESRSLHFLTYRARTFKALDSQS
jgi:hypothetical protein